MIHNACLHQNQLVEDIGSSFKLIVGPYLSSTLPLLPQNHFKGDHSSTADGECLREDEITHTTVDAVAIATKQTNATGTHWNLLPGWFCQSNLKNCTHSVGWIVVHFFHEVVTCYYWDFVLVAVVLSTISLLEWSSYDFPCDIDGGTGL